MMKKKDAQQLSQALMVGSVVAIVFAALGATGTDIWLASTQWLLVAVVLIGFGIFLKP